MRSIRLMRCLAWLSAAFLAASCAGQVMQRPGILPGQAPAREPVHHPAIHHAAAAPQARASDQATVSTETAKPAANGPARPPSLMDKPAEPAKIRLDGGLLTIRADNSSLSSILQHLTSSGGMKVDGFRQDQRVFGIYGPGDPRDVLSSLLQGAGYNFLMVGATEQGTPKEIVLTARTGGGATTGPAQPESSDDQSDDNDDNGDNSFTPPQPPPVVERPDPIPGASTAPANPESRVKTPAEIIQELQRLRQQQQNPQ